MNTHVPADFTLDELLAHLRDGDQEEAPGYKTSGEWADELEVPRSRMLAILKEAQDAGILLVSKGVRARIDGVEQRTAVYAFELDSVTGLETIDEGAETEK